MNSVRFGDIGGNVYPGAIHTILREIKTIHIHKDINIILLNCSTVGSTTCTTGM